MKRKSNPLESRLAFRGYGELRHQLGMWVLLVPTVFVLYFFTWRPLFQGFYMSLFETKGFKITDFVGLENYRLVLTNTNFLKVLGNTVKYVFWSLLFGGFTPLILAIMINEMCHFKEGFKFLIYLPSIIPGIAVSFIWSGLYDPSAGGLLNQMLSWFGIEKQQWLNNGDWTIALIMLSASWAGVGGTVIIYLAALQDISQDLYEAATIDGAGIWARIRYILLPHVAPMTLLMLVRQAIGIFQIMEQPMAMTNGGPNNASMSLNLMAYYSAFSYNNVDQALALGVITFCILIVVTAFYFRLDKKLAE